MYHVLGFFHHLAFCDPQGGLGDSHSEIVDLNTVELANGDLDRVVKVHNDLIAVEQADDLVFQPPQ